MHHLTEQTIRGLRRALLVACGVMTCLAVADAQTLDFRWHHFGDNSGTVVNTTTANGSQPIRSGAEELTFSYSIDRVVMPAIKGVPGSQEQIDAISAASRPVSGVHNENESYTKSRHQVVAGLSHGNLSASGYVSVEEDWRAHQASLGYLRELRTGNTVVGVRGSYGWDTITPIVDAGSPQTFDHRQALSGLVSLSQTLDVRTTSRLTAEVGRVTGFQGNPYRSVRTDSTIVEESHPRERLRTSISGEVLRYLDSRSSVRVGYRFYRDDWRVQSHTADAEFKQIIGHDVVLRYRYRYYTQQSAYFHRDRYVDTNGVNGYLTADYKLAPQSSNLFGVRLTFPALELLHLGRWFSDARLNLKYERYYNTNAFAAGIFETGVAFLF